MGEGVSLEGPEQTLFLPCQNPTQIHPTYTNTQSTAKPLHAKHSLLYPQCAHFNFLNFSFVLCEFHIIQLNSVDIHHPLISEVHPCILLHIREKIIYLWKLKKEKKWQYVHKRGVKL